MDNNDGIFKQLNFVIKTRQKNHQSDPPPPPVDHSDITRLFIKGHGKQNKKRLRAGGMLKFASPGTSSLCFTWSVKTRAATVELSAVTTGATHQRRVHVTGESARVTDVQQVAQRHTAIANSFRLRLDCVNELQKNVPGE